MPEVGLLAALIAFALLVVIPAFVWVANRVLAPKSSPGWYALETQRFRLDELALQMNKVIALLEEIRAALPKTSKDASQAIMPEAGLKQ